MESKQEARSPRGGHSRLARNAGESRPPRGGGEQILNLTSPQKLGDEAGIILKVHFHGPVSLMNLSFPS